MSSTHLSNFIKTVFFSINLIDLKYEKKIDFFKYKIQNYQSNCIINIIQK